MVHLELVPSILFHQNILMTKVSFLLVLISSVGMPYLWCTLEHLLLSPFLPFHGSYSLTDDFSTFFYDIQLRNTGYSCPLTFSKGRKMNESALNFDWDTSGKILNDPIHGHICLPKYVLDFIGK